ncbi:MAG: hypothetical protein IPJ30_06580 [Acidobacteria bacterium]|nr:hypothetical protein [Acidobacteriota bacterium]
MSLLQPRFANMWVSRTKNDLIIEVWEKLDCESVGAAEIEAIETAVADRFGAGAVESPMVIARLLADEGAELRHSEILELFVSRRQPLQEQAGRDLPLVFESVEAAIGMARAVEKRRRHFLKEGRTDDLKRLRERVLEAKSRAVDGSLHPRLEPKRRAELVEIAEWLTLWLQTPEIFENWLTLRLDSKDFKERFPETTETAD